MSYQDTTFGQLLQLIGRHDFKKWVNMHRGETFSKGFSCLNQITAILFGQLSSQTGLHGIESGLAMNKKNSTIWESKM